MLHFGICGLVSMRAIGQHYDWRDYVRGQGSRRWQMVSSPKTSGKSRKSSICPDYFLMAEWSLMLQGGNR